MKKPDFLSWEQVSRTANACLSGLEHWQEVLPLCVLLMLLAVLLLSAPGADARLLHLLRWLGSEYRWCATLRN